MPRQLYPGELKFRILRDEAKQTRQRADTWKRVAKLRQSQSQEQIAMANQLKAKQREKQRQCGNSVIAQQIEEAKQMKQRAVSQMLMANLWEKCLKEQQNNDIMAQQSISEQDIERYDLDFQGI